MNPLLILLGEKYHLRMSYDHYDGWRVTVSEGDFYVSKSFQPIEVECAPNDLLLFTVETCIMDLQEMTEDKNKIAEERARIKQKLNEQFGCSARRFPPIEKLTNFEDGGEVMMRQYTTEPIGKVKEKIEGPDGIVAILDADSVSTKYKDEVTRFCKKGIDLGIDLGNGPDMPFFYPKKE